MPNLILVSAGLGIRGGGSAAMGRLLASALAEIANGMGEPLEILHLGSPEPGLEALPIVHFDQNAHKLALHVIGLQVPGTSPSLLVFDHIGPARIQAIAPFRAPYAICMLGIEVWRKQTFTRRRAFKKANLVLAISEHTRRKALTFVPEAQRASVLPLALEDGTKGGEAETELLQRLRGEFFLIVGRMAGTERYKGHDELIEAIRLLEEDFPDAHVVVAGEGDDRPRLETRARELGVGDRISFVGFVNEKTLRELYRRCLAFVMPSRDEGFGLVYLEAMRAAKPCIAARGGAAGEIVKDGWTGLLVPYGDVDSLAGALRELLSNPQLCSDFGARGRHRYLTEFSLLRFTDRLKGHISGLVEESH